MSLYINGMEMPKRHNYVAITIWPNGIASCGVFDRDGILRDFKNIEAVSVPPHGRLIDASKKARVQMYDDMTEDYHIAEMTIDDLLSQGWVEADAPTIIQANVPDNNVGNIPEEGE